MQELIDAYYSIDKFVDFDTWITNNQDRLLEKEKEQMFDLIKFMRTNDKMGKSVEDLYNEFINQ